MLLQSRYHLQLRCWPLICCLAFSVCLAAQERSKVTIGLPQWDTDTAFIAFYIHKADSLMDLQHIDDAIPFFYKASQMAKKAGYHRAVVYSLAKLGNIYYNEKENYRLSRNFLYQAVPYLNKLSKKEQQRFVPEVYNVLANALWKNGVNDSAIYYYSLALKSFEDLSINRPQLLAQVYSNMGAILCASGQYVKGSDYLKKTLTFKEIDSTDLARNYENLGALYANYLSDIDSATYWWHHAVSIYRALSKKNKLQQLFTNMGVGWIVIPYRDVDKAKRYLDTAIQLDPLNAGNNNLLQQGLSAVNYYKGQYPDAIKYANRSLSLAEVSGDKDRKLNAYWVLSYSYEHFGDTQKAHEFQRKLQQLQDTVFNENMLRSVSDMEAKYRLSEKNSELAENKTKLYRQRLWLIGSISGGLLLIAALLSIVYYNKQKQQLYTVHIRDLEQQQQIENLHTRMDTEEKERARVARELHDGLGVLISAAKINHNLLGKKLPEDLSKSGPYKEGGDILDQIHEEMRTVVQNLIPDYIIYKSLEDALSVLIARIGDQRLQIKLQFYGLLKEMHPDKSYAIYRAIEEIINNTLKHAQGTELIIQVFYQTEKLHIITEDNGKGFDTAQTYRGLGLRNIVKRIEKIDGFITLSSQQGLGTTYTMEIPY